jgi:aryl-alcohol dehydrogenase-like predicted oxidoreductase
MMDRALSEITAVLQVKLLSGESAPALGQGTWQMAEVARHRGTEIEALRLGIELGLTLIDTAEMYGEGQRRNWCPKRSRGIGTKCSIPLWILNYVKQYQARANDALERHRPCFRGSGDLDPEAHYGAH